MNFTQHFLEHLETDIETSTNEQLYMGLLNTLKDQANTTSKVQSKCGKKLYYISAEFLIGKLLSNNLVNLGVYGEVKDLLATHGKSLSELEELELEPSLGNGGLGRLAACFLDSMATLGVHGHGIGLNYHLGLFKQTFVDNKQQEEPNPWITDTSWLRDTDVSFTVPFGKFNLEAKMKDLDIMGYGGGTNKLHLFDAPTVQEQIVEEGINFDKRNIPENLTLFLYPDDSTYDGQLLRIYQQYFMVSAGAQLILKECKEKGYNLRGLDRHVVIQINDTHPSLIIPELIRLLMLEGIGMNHAIKIVTKTCAYTNHTILAEALEKWPISFLEEVVPHLVPIIRELNQRVMDQYHMSELEIIDNLGRVHMARMDMHYCFSINGVAALHTEILKNVELKAFHNIYPEKFNNKTNGITFGRWLTCANPELSAWIEDNGGGNYRENPFALEHLMDALYDHKSLVELQQVKRTKKVQLAEYMAEKSGVELNPDSIFDIQVKRLHEYKRQQMNVLYVIYKYKEIKAGRLPKTPITIIFGAKAAPAYHVAKSVIHAILTLQQLIENDPEVSPHLKVVMVENYNVTWAEKLFPACDVSEQISLASKEASGTGNMKFMLNGAITIGTMDGANVEIAELVGYENIYIFGKNSDEVIALYNKRDYSARDYYDLDHEIKSWVDFLVSDEMTKYGDMKILGGLHGELIHKDYFMTLLDVRNYIETKERVFADYEDRHVWSKKMVMNIAKAGYFSSDRTIAKYNADIWRV